MQNKHKKKIRKQNKLRNQPAYKISKHWSYQKKPNTEINILNKRRNHQPIKNRDQRKTPGWNSESNASSKKSKHKNQLAIFCNQNYALHCPCMYNVMLVFGIGFRRAVFQRFGANFVGNLMRKMKMDVQSFSLLFAF